MRDFLHHLFFPRESNNHRARILHHTGLLAIIASFFVLELLFTVVHASRGDILGIRSDITVSELLSLTNKERVENGLPEVVLDQELSNAASQKAADMFAKNYWSHNSPDGTTPWVFIRSAGYDYLFAGENLARGFTTSSDVLTAWMDSPGHRENILSPNYKHIGFAVLPGQLTGDDTVLVVQMFGQKREATEDITQSAPQEVAQAQAPAVKPQEQREPQQVTEQAPGVASFQSQPLIDIKDATKGITTVILFIFLLALLLDVIIISRKKIVRVVAHNIDTIIFISVVMITIFLIGNGIVL